MIGCLTVFLTAGFAQESGNSQVQVLDGGWDLPQEKEKIERIGNDVRDLEVEVSAGYLCGSRIYGGARLSAELRYNIKNTGLDLGLQYSSMGGDLRDKKNSTGDRRSFTIQGMYGFFIDYNWRVWNNIAPFAGIGVGIAWLADDTVVMRWQSEGDVSGYFVQVVDRRAACMEPVSQLSGYRNGCYCAPQDNQTCYYFDRMPKGTHVIETEYYIDRAGTYDTGTCKAQCAYAPEYVGMAPAYTLVVR